MLKKTVIYTLPVRHNCIFPHILSNWFLNFVIFRNPYQINRKFSNFLLFVFHQLLARSAILSQILFMHSDCLLILCFNWFVKLLVNKAISPWFSTGPLTDEEVPKSKAGRTELTEEFCSGTGLCPTQRSHQSSRSIPVLTSGGRRCRVGKVWVGCDAKHPLHLHLHCESGALSVGNKLCTYVTSVFPVEITTLSQYSHCLPFQVKFSNV